MPWIAMLRGAVEAHATQVICCRDLEVCMCQEQAFFVPDLCETSVI